MRTLSLAAAILLGVTFQSSSDSSGGAVITLPPELAGYRQWKQLVTSPYEVPMRLWMLCRAPTMDDWNAAREEYGPHTRFLIRVYGNAVAVKAFSAGGHGPFPVGAMIAKEKFAGSPHGRAAGIAFMVKRAEPEFADTGGWQFLYYPSGIDRQAMRHACAPCHHNAPTDYVFGTYPR